MVLVIILLSLLVSTVSMLTNRIDFLVFDFSLQCVLVLVSILVTPLVSNVSMLINLFDFLVFDFSPLLCSGSCLHPAQPAGLHCVHAY